MITPNKASDLKIDRKGLNRLLTPKRKKKKKESLKHESFKPNQGKLQASVTAAGSPSAMNNLINALTPYQLAQEFPDYYWQKEAKFGDAYASPNLNLDWAGTRGMGGTSKRGDAKRNREERKAKSENQLLTEALEAATGIKRPGVNGVAAGSLAATIHSGEIPEFMRVSGETFNAYNQGEAHGYKAGTMDFSQMSLAEVMRRQNLPANHPDKLFATGAYQVIPSTMQEAVAALGLDPETTMYDPATQNRIFAYLTDKKRPAVGDFIRGNGDLDTAQMELAKEWASLPTLDGDSFYGKDGVNRAHVSVEESRAALEAARKAYSENIAAGMSEEDAYMSAITGMKAGEDDLPQITLAPDVVEGLPEKIRNLYENGDNHIKNIIANEYNKGGNEGLASIADSIKNQMAGRSATSENAKEIIAMAAAGEIPLASKILDTALTIEGLNENSDREAIKDYLGKGGMSADPVQTRWCAAFVNSTLDQVGVEGTGSMIANSFQDWGNEVSPEQVIQGDVLVEHNGLGPNESGGHVGFATGETRINDAGELEVEMYGGNQSNGANKKWIKASEVYARRAPEVDQNLQAIKDKAKDKLEEKNKLADRQEGKGPDDKKEDQGTTEGQAKEQDTTVQPDPIPRPSDNVPTDKAEKIEEGEDFYERPATDVPDDPSSEQFADEGEEAQVDGATEGATEGEAEVPELDVGKKAEMRPEDYAEAPIYTPSDAGDRIERSNKIDEIFGRDRGDGTGIDYNSTKDRSQKLGQTAIEGQSPESETEDPDQSGTVNPDNIAEPIAPNTSVAPESGSVPESVPDDYDGPITPKVDHGQGMPPMDNLFGKDNKGQPPRYQAPHAPRTFSIEGKDGIDRVQPIPNAPVTADPWQFNQQVPNMPVPTREADAYEWKGNDITTALYTDANDNAIQGGNLGPVDSPSGVESASAAIDSGPMINPNDLGSAPSVNEGATNQDDDQAMAPDEEPNQPQPQQGPSQGSGMMSSVSVPSSSPTGMPLNQIINNQHEWSPSAQRAFSRATNYNDSNSAKHFDYGATNTKTV